MTTRPSAAFSRTAVPILGLILAVGFFARLWPLLFHPSEIWADEIYQTIEPAHRLVYGTGLIPWEFDVGIRSWLVPGLIAGIFSVSKWLDAGPALYLPLTVMFFAAFALVPIYCCFMWAYRRFGLVPAALAALVPCLAPELVYFGARALVEVFASHLLILSLYLFLPSLPGSAVVPSVSARRRVVAAFLLALTIYLRVQLLPIVPVIMLWPGLRRAWREMMLGGLLCVAATGIFDMITLGAPWASIWRYFLYNFVMGAADNFGVKPLFYYVFLEIVIWGGAAVIWLGLIVGGTRLWRLPTVLACVIIVAHMAIGHKEWRFIYPALVLLSIAAGIGLAAFSQFLSSKINGPSHLVPGLSAAAWLASCLLVWNSSYLLLARENSHGHLLAADDIARQNVTCGIGLFDAKTEAWQYYGGYAHFHHDVPIFWPANDAEFSRYRQSFDVVAAKAPVPDPDFKREDCFGDVCVYRRTGGCVAQPMVKLPYPEKMAPLPTTGLWGWLARQGRG